MFSKENLTLITLAILLSAIIAWQLLPMHENLTLIPWILIGSAVCYNMIRKIYQSTRKAHKLQLLFVTCAIAITTLPSFHWNQAATSPSENRTLAKWPIISWETFYDGSATKGLEEYINDRFFGRQKLLWLEEHYRNLLALDGRIENKKVFAGKNDWLFYKGASSVELYQNKLLFQENQYPLIQKNLEAQQQWLKAHDMEYFLLIPPNKEDLYGEYLVPGIKKGIAPAKDRISLAIEYLEANHSSFMPIYPLSAMQKARHETDGLLFYKTDTHWSFYGAYFGYMELMQQICHSFPNLPILEQKNMDFSKKEKYDNGDLAIMLNRDYTKRMKHVWYIEPEPMDGWHYEIVEQRTKTAGILPQYLRTFNPRGKYRVMVFCDSFTLFLQPYLSETFHEVIYFWDHRMDHYREEILAEKPDIVIVEVLSRHAQVPLLEIHMQEASA